MPGELEFEEKWRLALAQTDQMLADDLPPAPVVADAGYGSNTEFREGLTRGLAYAVGIMRDTTLAARTGSHHPISKWRPRPARQAFAPRSCSSAGCGPRLGATAGPHKLATGALARGNQRGDAIAFRTDQCAPAHRDQLRVEPRPPELLLIEWSLGEREPARYWLSTLPAGTDMAELVRLAKVRWRIERDYQELKDEIGLDHYEGRNWRGFHHHGALCIAAYAFLAAERARLSPPAPVAFLRPARLPAGFRPRGAAGAS